MVNELRTIIDRLDGKTKTRNMGGKFVKGTTPAKKKAIVQLTADSKEIDIVEGL